ncbi:hypothetical protein ACFYVK_16475 [Streptomyces chartreusis]|uniref:hypothetical protein n=1 Tax=Streptomyces chartreusis TaxID=1969 RepID=UPI0036C702B2
MVTEARAAAPSGLGLPLRCARAASTIRASLSGEESICSTQSASSFSRPATSSAASLRGAAPPRPIPPLLGCTNRRQAAGTSKVSSSGRTTSSGEAAASTASAEPSTEAEAAVAEAVTAPPTDASTSRYPLRSFSAITFARWSWAASAESSSFACVRPSAPTRP